ncbi:IS30 family transposase, partial [Georgenia sp. MJ206]|uniref:transposase n=1 Tax=Georgenia wangjunii TaxID=3117730 RepID=UPI002F2A301D
MTLHQEFTAATGVPVYFYNPYSPWQRGTNENSNGLLRQYFPKKTALRAEAPIPLLEAVAQINARPR